MLCRLQKRGAENERIINPDDFGYAIDYPRRQIAFRGEMGITSARRAAETITELQHQAVGDINIRLDQLHFISIDGLNAIMTASGTQAAVGSQLIISGASVEIRRTFHASDLSDLLCHG